MYVICLFQLGFGSDPGFLNRLRVGSKSEILIYKFRLGSGRSGLVLQKPDRPEPVATLFRTYLFFRDHTATFSPPTNAAAPTRPSSPAGERRVCTLSAANAITGFSPPPSSPLAGASRLPLPDHHPSGRRPHRRSSAAISDVEHCNFKLPLHFISDLVSVNASPNFIDIFFLLLYFF